MRGVFTVLSGILMATASAGEAAPASAPGEAEAFVQVAEQDFDHAVRILGVPERPKKPLRKDAARIAIQCQFIALRARDLTDLGFRFDKPAIVISAERLGKLTEFARSVLRAPPLVSVRYADSRCTSWAESTRKGGVILTRNVTVAGGERLVVQVLRNLNFIAGIDLDPANLERPVKGGQLVGEPIIGNLPDGLALECQAETVAKATRFALISTRMVVPVTFLRWEALVEVGGEEVGLGSQEPCVLVWKSTVPNPCDIVVPPGQSVLIPLRERSLVVLRSPTRALAKKHKVRLRSDETAQFLSQFDKRGYPLEADTKALAVLTPQVVEAPLGEF